jgi:hypothetical protein
MHTLEDTLINNKERWCVHEFQVKIKEKCQTGK